MMNIFLSCTLYFFSSIYSIIFTPHPPIPIPPLMKKIFFSLFLQN